MVLTAAVIFVLMLAASFVPARCTAAIEPVQALRGEGIVRKL